ncbi:kinesin-like protein KIF18B isoform X2 [Heliangelus exortis]|uniref:kinesin-like protein KIF18B isoform X2 n=1 Tax=Heliangelus exortis TaxID=472823 RepID=UPI003A921496
MAPSTPLPEEGTVAVMVRVRPPAPSERDRSGPPLLHLRDQNIIVFDPEEPGGLQPPRGPKHHGKDLTFVFDRVFGEGATQEEVFQHTTRGLLDSVLSGYNCSVFAYGATGAGKTYTMLGSEKNPGIMYLTMVELYRRIEARKEEKGCEVLVSYQEVYNEQIHDLLEPKGPLTIREDPEKGVVVQGLSFHQPASAEQLLKMLADGNKNRTQHPTDANASSSRSHAIFQVHVKQWDRSGGLAQDLQVAKMSLIDLAGSERASVTNTKGQRLREGANINRSLLALINVINALADTKSKKSHVPYRDSKLTRLLKDSLGGNCRTVMVAAVSPAAPAYEDTYNTLKYASRAKEIKLLLKSNVVSLDSHSCRFAVTCEQLKAEVAELRGKLRTYEDAAQEVKNQTLLPPVSSSPVGLPRFEDAVPKTGSAVGDREEGDGEEMELELEAGWPLGPQLGVKEKAPEEMPPSSSGVTQQTDTPQLEPKELSHLLQGLSSSQIETLVTTLLCLVRRQCSLLRDHHLLTPTLALELQELESLIHPEPGLVLEPNSSASSPTGQKGEQSSDAVPLTPHRTAPHGSHLLLPLTGSTPVSLGSVKRRRGRSETRSNSQPGTPHIPRAQRRSQRGGEEAAEPQGLRQSPGSPCLAAAAAQPLGLSPVPWCCPQTLSKARGPLSTLAAQNGGTLPVPPPRVLNLTYEICDSPQSPAPNLPGPPGWESTQNLRNKQDGSFPPRPCIPQCAPRCPNIHEPPTLPKDPAPKRRRLQSTSSPSLGGPQSRIPQLQRSVRPSQIPGSMSQRGCRRRTSKRVPARSLAPPVPTPQPRELLC